jgi:hypothetical protein
MLIMYSIEQIFVIPKKKTPTITAAFLFKVHSCVSVKSIKI